MKEPWIVAMRLAEPGYIRDIVAHTLGESPRECCGVVSGREGRATRLYRATNTSLHPRSSYAVAPEELLDIYRDIDDHGWDVLAIYHSHPWSEAYPSPTDVKLWAWPKAYCLIASLRGTRPELRAFRIRHGQVETDD